MLDKYILAVSSNIYQHYIFKFKLVSYETSKIYHVGEIRTSQALSALAVYWKPMKSQFCLI